MYMKPDARSCLILFKTSTKSIFVKIKIINWHTNIFEGPFFFVYNFIDFCSIKFEHMSFQKASVLRNFCVCHFMMFKNIMNEILRKYHVVRNFIVPLLYFILCVLIFIHFFLFLCIIIVCASRNSMMTFPWQL